MKKILKTREKGSWGREDKEDRVGGELRDGHGLLNGRTVGIRAPPSYTEPCEKARKRVLGGASEYC